MANPHRHRRIAAKKPTCAYCQNRANSDEESCPKWVNKEYHRLDLDTFSVHIADHTGAWIRRLENTASHTKYKVVCKTCNNEWMSGLERRVSKFLKPALSSLSPWQLNAAEDIVSLVRWAVNRTIIVDYATNPMGSFFLLDERHEFRRSLTVPNGFHLWVTASKFRVNQSRSAVTPDIINDDGRPFRYLLTLYQVGHFLFESICIKWTDAKQLDPPPPILQPDDWVRQVESIWPSYKFPFSWPPGDPLDVFRFKQFLNRRHAGGVAIPGDPLNYLQ